MKANLKGIILIIACSLSVAIAQILLKIGADKITSFSSIIFNSSIIFGMLMYLVGMLLLMFALKNSKLNIVYPFVALSYVWVAIMAFYLLSESIPVLHWLGIFSIVFGVSLIGGSS